MDLYLRDWRENGGKQTIGLKSGLNMLEAEIDGMGYIQYWTDTEVAAPAVKIHVCYGNEFGFWDVRAGHTNEDWKRILSLANTCTERLNITNAMLDVLGERVQLINTVNAFNIHCPSDIASVMNMHDELMQIEYTVMGLVKIMQYLEIECWVFVPGEVLLIGMVLVLIILIRNKKCLIKEAFFRIFGCSGMNSAMVIR